MPVAGRGAEALQNVRVPDGGGAGDAVCGHRRYEQREQGSEKAPAHDHTVNVCPPADAARPHRPKAALRRRPANRRISGRLVPYALAASMSLHLRPEHARTGKSRLTCAAVVMSGAWAAAPTSRNHRFGGSERRFTAEMRAARWREPGRRVIRRGVHGFRRNPEARERR